MNIVKSFQLITFGSSAPVILVRSFSHSLAVTTNGFCYRLDVQVLLVGGSGALTNHPCAAPRVPTLVCSGLSGLLVSPSDIAANVRAYMSWVVW